MKTDATATGDEQSAVVKGVVGLGNTVINPRRRGVDLARAFHAERFVRSFVVELFDERVEPGLLLKEISAGGTRRLLFQCQVHALMASVLLGMAGPNAFDRDAEAQPPDGEAGELKQAVRRSEGNAVIRANRQGQAAFPEQAFESGKRQVFPRGFERFAQQ